LSNFGRYFNFVPFEACVRGTGGGLCQGKGDIRITERECRMREGYEKYAIFSQ